MAKINDIKNIIASAAAKNNMPTYENGNTALKVAEPVIPLPNNPSSGSIHTRQGIRTANATTGAESLY